MRAPSVTGPTQMLIGVGGSQPPDMAVADLAELIQERQAAAAQEGGAQLAPGERITLLITPPRRTGKAAPAIQNGCSPSVRGSSACPADATPDVISAGSGATATPEAGSGYLAFACKAAPLRLISGFNSACKGLGRIDDGTAPPCPEDPSQLPMTATASSAGMLLSLVKGVGNVPYYSSVRMLRAAASPLALIPGFG